jgi:hypothetical protein
MMATRVNISLLFLILSVVVGNLLAQETTVRGFVYEEESGQPVLFCNILVKELGSGATADENGFYIIQNMQTGNYTLQASTIGFDTASIAISLNEGQVLSQNFYLRKVSYTLSEVSISSEKVARENNSLISEKLILPKQINELPSIGGMPDLIQKIQTIPGVVSSGDVGGQIFIRGGSPVQNKTIMDGAIIYAPVHSIGLFSVFDPGIIKKVDFYTGGFGAQYGGAISSVMDVSTRYGNLNHTSGKVAVSTIASSILLEGPILKKKKDEGGAVSFIIAARNSHLDFASEHLYSYLDYDLPYKFTDVYGKLSFIHSKTIKANLFGFYYDDETGNSSTLSQYRRKSSGIGGNILIIPQRTSLLMELYFTVSNFEMTLDETNLQPRSSRVGSTNFGIRFNAFRGRHNLKYGLDMIGQSTDYSYYTTQFNKTTQTDNSTEIAAYVQAKLNFNKIVLEPGLRLQAYASLYKFLFEPRIAMKWLVTENFRLKAAAGLYSQNLISAYSDRDIVNFFFGYLSAPVDMVRDPGGEEPDMLQKSRQLIGGFEYDMGEYFFINLEAYYKNYPSLINYNRNKVYNENDFPDEPEILTKDFISETGYAKGIDFYIQYLQNKLKGEFSYSYAKTERTYDSENGEAVTYYPHYDRRHNVNLIFSISFGKMDQWSASARWNYGSGFPFTETLTNFESISIGYNDLTGYLTQNGDLSMFYGELNEGRLPAYDRLDCSVMRRFTFGRRMILEAEFNIINVYNQKNIYYINRQTNEVVYQLPFLPGVRVSIEF